MAIDPGLIIFIGFFALVGGRLLYTRMKFGGFKAAMFGAPIEDTVGDVTGAGSGTLQLTFEGSSA